MVRRKEQRTSGRFVSGKNGVPPARDNAPHAHGVMVSGGGQQEAIRGKRGCLDGLGELGESADLATFGQVPNDRFALAAKRAASGSQQAAVGAEGQRPDAMPVTRQDVRSRLRFWRRWTRLQE